MPFARGRRGLRSGTQRRKIDRHWSQFDFGLTLTGTDVTSLIGDWVRAPSGVIDTITGLQVEENETLVRTRIYSTGQIQYNAGSVVGPGRFESAVGIIAWSGYKNDQPPTELPDPTSSHWPWLYRHQQAILLDRNQFMSATVGRHIWDNRFGPESLIDSRAQRKLPDMEGLLLVRSFWASFQGGGTIVADTLDDVSTFYKDP